MALRLCSVERGLAVREDAIAILVMRGMKDDFATADKTFMFEILVYEEEGVLWFGFTDNQRISLLSRVC